MAFPSDLFCSYLSLRCMILYERTCFFWQNCIFEWTVPTL